MSTATGVQDPVDAKDDIGARLIQTVKAEIAKTVERSGALVGDLEKKIAAEIAKGDARDAAAIESLNKRVSEEIVDMRKMLEKLTSTFRLPGSDDAKGRDGKKFNFQKAYQGVATNDWRNAQHEKAIFDEMQQKAMATSPDSAGGFIVPDEVLSDQIIPFLRAESIALQLGARLLDGLTRIPTFIPRVSGGTTGFWVAESAAITPSDLTLQQLTLTPHILATMTIVSDLLLMTSTPAVDQLLREDMASELAVKLDLGVLVGGGAGQPTGLFTAASIPTVSVADPATFNELVNVVQTVRGNNGLKGKLGWALSNADLTEIWQIVDASTTQPLQRRVLADGPATTLLGYPYRVSTQLTDGQIAFGNFSDLIIAQWGTMMIASTNALGFATMQNHIRASMYLDAGVRNVKSFAKAA